MEFLNGFKGVLKFLTIFPIKVEKEYDSLEKIAEHIYFFPIVGAFIGFLAGVFPLIAFRVLSNLLVGIITLGITILITGLHHADGLLDFGDGILAHGSKSEKIKVMRDPHIGVGGFFIGFIVFSITALCIANLNNINFTIIKSLIVSEVIAKFGMVFLMFLGKEAYEGTASPFIKAMHSRRGNLKFFLTILFTLVLITPLLGIISLITLFSGIIFCSLILKVSTTNFGGVTGDVIGATNELLRMVTLLILVIMKRWI